MQSASVEDEPVMNLASDQGEFHRGLDLFNRAHFFDAHEVLEDVWRALPRDRPLRRHLQGMVQLAVAFHHVAKGNHLGARSVLARALRNLNGAENSCPDLDLVRLRSELKLWQQYPDDFEGAGERRDERKSDWRDVPRHTVPALPKILLRPPNRL